MTKEERQKYKKEYYEANKDKIKDRVKEYSEANKDKIKAYRKANKGNEYFKEYYVANKDKMKDKMKEYREANPDKIKDKTKKYYQANKDKIKAYREANKGTEYFKEYYVANKDKIKDNKKEYYVANKDKVKDKMKEYYQANKANIFIRKTEYVKNRKATDPLYKLTCNIRSLIVNAMRKMKYKKTSRTAEILGCSFEEFKVHIEQQFPRDMNWDNAGVWHYDHIKPVSSATSEEELLRLNHYTNFQPLWGEDNIEKSDKPNWVKCPIKYAK